LAGRAASSGLTVMTRSVGINGMNPLCIACVAEQCRTPRCCAEASEPSSRQDGRSGSLLEELHRLEHVVDVARHLQAAPFLLEDAVGADEEGAALNALHLLAVHDLVLHHA